MAHLHNAMAERFRERAANALLQRFPDHVSEETVASEVRAGLAEAKLYRMNSEDEALVFLSLRLLCGSDFPTNAKYSTEAAILRTNELTSATRLQLLNECLLEQIEIGKDSV